MLKTFYENKGVGFLSETKAEPDSIAEFLLFSYSLSPL